MSFKRTTQKSTKAPKNNKLTVAQVKTLAHGKDWIIEGLVDGFNKYADEYEINTPLRKAHFLAQLVHESAHLRTTVEYSGSSRRYAPWYGRGLIQLTWKENYADFYTWCVEKGLNPPKFFETRKADEASKFPWAFLSAIWYWNSRNLNKYADQDNVRQVTRRINGGYNGLQDRINYLNKAKKVFGVDPLAVDTTAGSITVKFTVRQVQEALVSRGYSISVDGKMGPSTLAAVRLFQKTYGLVPDGIIGPKTADKLFV